MDFETKLGAMVAKELTGSPEQGAALIERLTDSLGLAIAMATKGDPAAADTMMTGVEGYLAEAVAQHSKLARLMAGLRDNRP